MTLRAKIMGALLVVATASPASGFGTLSGRLGQNREHERITRLALACGAGAPAIGCFEPRTLDELAGKNNEFGAVGASDNPVRGLFTLDEAHCDNGDYLNTPGYPQSRTAAESILSACRAWMDYNLNRAVYWAPILLNGNSISLSQTAITSCRFWQEDPSDSAKCRILAFLGLSLHASQDFYSHTNWVDVPSAAAISTVNPPGLDNGQHAAAWLDLRNPAGPVPAGLISGCFEEISAVSAESVGCKKRVRHQYLNKDKGPIQPYLGIGTTERGKIGVNFVRAVSAAISDTQDKLAILHERLQEHYKGLGDKMFCAITHDAPTDLLCP